MYTQLEILPSDIAFWENKLKTNTETETGDMKFLVFCHGMALSRMQPFVEDYVLIKVTTDEADISYFDYEYTKDLARCCQFPETVKVIRKKDLPHHMVEFYKSLGSYNNVLSGNVINLSFFKSINEVEYALECNAISPFSALVAMEFFNKQSEENVLHG